MIFFEYANKDEMKDVITKKPEVKTFYVSEDQHGHWQMVKAPNEAEAIVEYFKILNLNLSENVKKIVCVKSSSDHSTVNAYTFEMKLEPAYYIDYYGEMP